MVIWSKRKKTYLNYRDEVHISPKIHGKPFLVLAVNSIAINKIRLFLTSLN